MKVKNADIICYMLTSLVYLQQGNVKKSRKIKGVNIDKENLQLRMTRKILMRFSGKMFLMTMLIVIKNSLFRVNAMLQQ